MQQPRELLHSAAMLPSQQFSVATLQHYQQQPQHQYQQQHIQRIHGVALQPQSHHSFQHLQQQQQQQQQRHHHQHHHQVQLYQGNDLLFQVPGNANPSPVPMLDMAVAYRQRANQAEPQFLRMQQQQHQQQPQSQLAANWDERTYLRHQQQQQQQQQSQQQGFQLRASQDTVERHGRNVYWQATQYSSPTKLSSPPVHYRVVHPSERYIENSPHYNPSRSSSRLVVHSDAHRDYRRSLSPVLRLQRFPNSGLDSNFGRKEHGFSRGGLERFKKDDDEREDGQVTPPPRSPDRPRRKVYHHGRNAGSDFSRSDRTPQSRHWKSSLPQKRDRSAVKEKDEPSKKSKPAAKKDAPVVASVVTAEPTAPQAESSRKESSQQTAKHVGTNFETSRKELRQQTVEHATPTVDTVRKESSRQQTKHVLSAGVIPSSKLGVQPSGLAAAFSQKAAESQTPAAVVFEELGASARVDNVKVVSGSEASKDTGGAPKADIAAATLVSTAGAEPASSGKEIAIATAKPTVFVDLTRTCNEETDQAPPEESPAPVEKPPEIAVGPTAQNAAAPIKAAISEMLKQPAVTIRKNPSIPVSFQPRLAGSSKTWRRTSETGTGIGAPKAVTQAAYIRKGNSLVRAGPSPAVMQPPKQAAALPRTVRAITTKAVETPTSVQVVTEQIAGSPVQSQSLPSSCTTPETSTPEVSPAHLKPADVEMADANSTDSQPLTVVKETDGSIPDSTRAASVLYVRSKANQLVASPLREVSKPSSTSVDGYVKRKTNQLVRSNQLGSPLREEAPVFKTKLGKVLGVKKLRASWVWTLGGVNKMAPSLIPWKRRFHGRAGSRRLKSLPKASKGSLLFFISEKLQGLRTSHPLYTRSGNGFSLRRSGVRSVAGSLKWTKSLEKFSREANEEATKALAAVEKQCREDKQEARRRERIVLVGLVHYKMDPSRRVLQRLTDSPDASSEKTASSALLTPRRSSIGGAVYVRMGNGNQLVRDPKASSRAVASEKIRWSLHNVRSRIAKKQQYCQFFTRYGKCKKADNKCPYIHDKEKVVVCTKFLKGSCATKDCLLTHKVIPERMPDCSFFLEGLCINDACPYRHVHVNPASPVCEDFLKGYCPRGDECNKKHSYVCPAYSASGECPERQTCKLHHPKKKDKPASALKVTKKRKRRYFATFCDLPPSKALAVEPSSTRPAAAGIGAEPSQPNDFISLDNVTVEEEMDARARMLFQNGSAGSSSGFSLLSFNGMADEEVEKLIKPSFVLQRAQLAN